MFTGRNLDFLFLFGLHSLPFRSPRFCLFYCSILSKCLYHSISHWLCTINGSLLNNHLPLTTESYSCLFNSILGMELLAGISIDIKGLLYSFLSVCVWVFVEHKYLTPSADPCFLWGIFVCSSWPLQRTQSNCIDGKWREKFSSPSAGYLLHLGCTGRGSWWAAWTRWRLYYGSTIFGAGSPPSGEFVVFIEINKIIHVQVVFGIIRKLLISGIFCKLIVKQIELYSSPSYLEKKKMPKPVRSMGGKVEHAFWITGPQEPQNRKPIQM